MENFNRHTMYCPNTLLGQYIVCQLKCSEHFFNRSHDAVDSKNYAKCLFAFFCLQCFDAVGWAAERASGL